MNTCFNPKALPSSGPAATSSSPAGRVFKNIKDNGYKGALWPVKSQERRSAGNSPPLKPLRRFPAHRYPCHPGHSVQIRHCRPYNPSPIKAPGAVIILTAGFGEKNEAGKEMEQEMLRIGRAAGMAIIGPNCSGFLTNTYKGKFAGIVPKLPRQGRGHHQRLRRHRGLHHGTGRPGAASLSAWLSIWVIPFNTVWKILSKCTMSSTVRKTPRCFLSTMESVKKPKMLLEHARNLIKKGCAIVGIKSGATPGRGTCRRQPQPAPWQAPIRRFRPCSKKQASFGFTARRS